MDLPGLDQDIHSNGAQEIIGGGNPVFFDPNLVRPFGHIFKTVAPVRTCHGLGSVFEPQGYAGQAFFTGSHHTNASGMNV